MKYIIYRHFKQVNKGNDNIKQFKKWIFDNIKMTCEEIRV